MILAPDKPKDPARFAGRLPRHLKSRLENVLCSACHQERTTGALLCTSCLKEVRNAQRRADYENACKTRRQREAERMYGDNPLRAQDLHAEQPVRSLPPRVTCLEDYQRELARIFPLQSERDLFQKRLGYFLRHGPFNAEQVTGRYYNLAARLPEALDLDPRLEHVPQRGGRQRWRLRQNASPNLATTLAHAEGEAARPATAPSADIAGDAHA